MAPRQRTLRLVHPDHADFRVIGIMLATSRAERLAWGGGQSVLVKAL
jgi:hypothetical protein